MNKKQNITVVQQIRRDKIKQLIYAAYYMGAMAQAEGKLMSHDDCIDERKTLFELIDNDLA